MDVVCGRFAHKVAKWWCEERDVSPEKKLARLLVVVVSTFGVDDKNRCCRDSRSLEDERTAWYLSLKVSSHP